VKLKLRIFEEILRGFMKKILFLCLVLISLSGCADSEANKKKFAELQSQIDSLNRKINTFEPGLGEIMSAVQMHHAKLWFAGTSENWKLATFEIGELKEQFEAAEQLKDLRPEVASLPMIYPAVDSISHAVTNHDLVGFRGGFEYLTSSCNICHQVNKFEFNVIAIPKAEPVVNQIFRLPKNK